MVVVGSMIALLRADYKLMDGQILGYSWPSSLLYKLTPQATAKKQPIGGAKGEMKWCLQFMIPIWWMWFHGIGTLGDVGTAASYHPPYLRKYWCLSLSPSRLCQFVTPLSVFWCISFPFNLTNEKKKEKGE